MNIIVIKHNLVFSNILTTFTRHIPQLPSPTASGYQVTIELFFLPLCILVFAFLKTQVKAIVFISICTNFF